MTGKPTTKLYVLKFQGISITPQDRKHAFIHGSLGDTSPGLRRHQMEVFRDQRTDGGIGKSCATIRLHSNSQMNFGAPQSKLTDWDLAQPSHLDTADDWASPDLEYGLASS